MRHNQSILMALMREPNDTVFQKTLAVSDFYFGADDWEFPLGLIQMCATSHGAQIRGEALPGWLEWVPKMPFEEMARHSMDFWLSSEDLPRPENRIFYDGDRVVLDITESNMEAHHRLKKKLEQMLSRAGAHPVLMERSLYLGKNIPIGGTAHQAGTARFGTDPATSVLDLDCKAHELDNLYLADASFFPSIGAVNPTLTIIANALRVADKIKLRLGDVMSGPYRRLCCDRQLRNDGAGRLATARSIGSALPRFDSAACFAALLGDPEHGRWLIAPAGRHRRMSRAVIAATP